MLYAIYIPGCFPRLGGAVQEPSGGSAKKTCNAERGRLVASHFCKKLPAELNGGGHGGIMRQQQNTPKSAPGLLKAISVPVACIKR